MSSVAAGPEPVMQPRCVKCKREQYAIGVLQISLGLAGCAHCAHIPPVFTDPADYQAALRAPVEGRAR